jgi:hypothetical protein
MNRNIIIAILLIAFVSSCLPSSREEKAQKSSDWKTVTTDHFTFRVPNYLKEATELHEDAVVQFQNPVKEFYLISIEESQKQLHNAIVEGGLQDDYRLNLEGYATLIGDKFSDNVDELISKSENKALMVQGDSAMYFEAEAKVNGIKIFYHYSFIKGDSLYYQIMSWTLPSKKEKAKPIMQEILTSFKEK